MAGKWQGNQIHSLAQTHTYFKKRAINAKENAINIFYIDSRGHNEITNEFSKTFTHLYYTHLHNLNTLCYAQTYLIYDVYSVHNIIKYYVYDYEYYYYFIHHKFMLLWNVVDSWVDATVIINNNIIIIIICVWARLCIVL